MATADLKLIYGGGGSFKPSFFSGGLSIPSGSSGALLTLTAPAGKKVRLLSLNVFSGLTEAAIQVTSEGSTVIPSSTLTGSSLATGGAFGIGRIAGGNDTTVGVVVNSSIDYIESNTTIVVTKTVGNTTNVIYYSYAYGD